jgi:hypothetical protein
MVEGPKLRSALRHFVHEIHDAHKPICRAIHRPVIPVNLDARTCTWAGAFLLYNSHAKTATTDTTNDGANDPVPTAWGHSKGRTPGSFTPSLVHRL